MKSTILATIIIIIAVIVAVVVVQVTGVDLFQKQAEGGVVEIAIAKLFDTKTFKINAKIDADVKSSLENIEGDAAAMLSGLSDVRVFVDVLTTIDKRKKDEFKTSSNIKFGIDTQGMLITGIIEAITIDGGLYIQLVSIPPTITAIFGNLDSIKNQWMQLDIVAIKDRYKQIANQAGIDFNEKELIEQLKELALEMKNLLISKSIFDITKEFGKEEINKISTKHYSVSVDKEAIKEFVIEYSELTKKYIPASEKADYEVRLQEAMQGFSENFEMLWADMGGVNFDIWVENRTGRLARILWKKDIDPSRIQDIPKEIDEITLKIDFSFFDFNEKYDIKAPVEYKSFQDVLSGLMSSFVPPGFGMPTLPAGM